MNRNKYSWFLTAVVVFIIPSFIAAQTELPHNWHVLSPSQDKVAGIDLKNAYQFIKEKHLTPTKIIVAVLDSGTDTTHEDLKNVLWHNPKEIPNNGIDDDHNGYIDDVYGWNFLGGKNGESLDQTDKEEVRIYHQYKDVFLGKNIDSFAGNKSVQQKYLEWKSAAKALEINEEEAVKINYLDAAEKMLKRMDSILQTATGWKEYTPAQLEKYEPTTGSVTQAKFGYLTFTKLLNIEQDEKNTTTFSELDEFLENKHKALTAIETPIFDNRSRIIKDDYNNIHDMFYGNNDVMGKFARHGTHVAGIIAAERNNGKGIEGIANNVAIMTVRVVPNGDEYDKDVALGIIYAVNNGAKIINMSFGKGYSPERKWVDSAIRYALQKDVLVVHAAGNESSNLEVKESYPSPYLLNEEKDSIYPNMITVGASSSINNRDSNVIANFSNYSKKEVNVFAPGYKIYSSVPTTNQYAKLSGTSMAAPVVSGIAALIRVYCPTLTAEEVREAIEASVWKPTSPYKIVQPGNEAEHEQVALSALCQTGGIVNAGAAMKKAFELSNSKKRTNK